MKSRYDSIICGAGLSGSLLAHCLRMKGEKVLIYDAQKSTRQHMTAWWAKDSDAILTSNWKWKNFGLIDEKGRYYNKTLSQYVYKATWNNDLLEELKKGSDFVQKNLSDDDLIQLSLSNTDAKLFDGRYVQPKEDKHEINQIFYGQVLEYDHEHVYHEPVLFDLRPGKGKEPIFSYILPLSKNRLFVELVSFIKADVKSLHQKYLQQNNLTNGKVVFVESGLTPLFQYNRKIDNKITEIGIRGGILRPSNGYGMPYFLKDAQLLANSSHYQRGNLAKILDAIFLKAIKIEPSVNVGVLSAMSAKFSGDEIFAFMDENYSLKRLLKLLLCLRPLKVLRFVLFNIRN